ncbi:hypothetical protein I6F37_43740, partial [Bradyrhizobium sp. NBAIM08]|nr:hypothetical protein [Bradyrhizobium sp. NBAIM08]
GGLRILDRIEALDFRSLQTRPTIGPRDAVPMLWQALRMRAPPARLARGTA